VAESRVESGLSNPLYTQGAAAHARYYGRFSLLKPVPSANLASPTRTRHRGTPLDQRLRDDERAVALEATKEAVAAQMQEFICITQILYATIII